MKQKKKIWLVTLVIAITLALCAGCTRKGYNYYPGQFVAQNVNYNPGQFVAQDINYNSGQFVAVNNNYTPAPSVAQAQNYYFGPYISVVTGTLTSKTIITTAQSVMARLQCQNLNPVKEKYRQYTRVVLRGISANRVDNTVAAVKRAGFADLLIQRE
jgi:predicted small lipoprotein YifL